MMRLKRFFKKLSMRYKLLLAYCVPLVIFFVFLTVVSYGLIQWQYREEILYSAEQSYNQALGVFENHLQNMNDMLDRMEQDETLLTLAAPARLCEEEEYPGQWRHYLELNNELLSLEASAGLYRCSIYVPDELFYSGNRYHFYPQSDLENMEDYKLFRSQKRGDDIFAAKMTDSGQEGEIVLLRTLSDSQGNPVVSGRVNISVKELERVLNLSDITGKGISCLTDSAGRILVSSDQDTAALSEMVLSFGGGKKVWEERQTKEDKRVLVRGQKLMHGGLMLYSVVPYSDFYSQARLIGCVLIVSAVLMVLFILAISWLLARYYTGRLMVLNQNMEQIREGNVNLEIQEEESDEIGQLYCNFNYMAKEIRQLMLGQYRLGRDVKNAEMKALQAQINPHFLYNTLDLINWAALDYHAMDIVEIAQNLAKFYRVSLNHGKQVVTIQEELNQVRAYVKIENYHFDGAISYEEEVPEEVKTFACINILLQPFVENAIMYSLAKVPDRVNCHIRLKIEQSESGLLFLIEDDGIGMDAEESERIFGEQMEENRKGYGVRNVNFRIKLCYGEKYGIRCKSEKGKGTCIYIRIPAMTVEELEEQLK